MRTYPLFESAARCGKFLACCALLLASGHASAATVSADFDVTFEVQTVCTLAAAALVFPAANGAITADVNAQTSLTVNCSNGVQYTIALSGGGSNDVTNRQLTGQARAAGTDIGYTLYRDAARTLNWGETTGTDTLAGNGIGADQGVTIYGSIPAAPFGVGNTPPAGTYQDTITATITY